MEKTGWSKVEVAGAGLSWEREVVGPGQGLTGELGGKHALSMLIPLLGVGNIWGAHLVRDQRVRGFLLCRGAVLCSEDAGE